MGKNILVIGNIPKTTRMFLDKAEYNFHKISIDEAAAATSLPALPRPARSADLVWWHEEKSVVPAAKLRQLLSIDGLGREAAETVTDKLKMKSVLAKLNGITPSSISVTSRQELRGSANKLGFPVVLKPSHGTTSKFVSVNHSQEQLADNFAHMPAGIPYIVEKAVEGELYTLTGFADKKGRLQFTPAAVKNITAQVYSKTQTHTIACMLPAGSTELKRLLEKTVDRAAKAIGLRSCPVFADLIVSPDGTVKLIEISARMGGFRARMFMEAYGIDLNRSMYRAISGKSLEVKQPSMLKYCAVVSLLSGAETRLKNIAIEKTIRKLDSFVEWQQRYDSGSRVGPSSLGYGAIANVLMSNDNHSSLQKDIEAVFNRKLF